MAFASIELSSCETAASANAADALAGCVVVSPRTLTSLPVVVSLPLKASPGLFNCMVPRYRSSDI